MRMSSTGVGGGGFGDASMSSSRTRARGVSPLVQSNDSGLFSPELFRSKPQGNGGMYQGQDMTAPGVADNEAVDMQTDSTTSWNDMRPPPSSSSSFAPPSILSASKATSRGQAATASSNNQGHSSHMTMDTTTTATVSGPGPARGQGLGPGLAQGQGLGPGPMAIDQERRVEFSAYDSNSSSHRSRIASLLSSASSTNQHNTAVTTSGTTKAQGLGLGQGQGLASMYPDNLTSHMAMATSTTYPGPRTSPGTGAASLGTYPTTTTTTAATISIEKPSSSQRRVNYFDDQSPMVDLSQLPNPNDFREELYSPLPPPPPAGNTTNNTTILIHHRLSIALLSIVLYLFPNIYSLISFVLLSTLPGGVTPSSSTSLPPSSSSSAQQQQRGLLPFNSNSTGKRFGFHSSSGVTTTGPLHEGTLHSGAFGSVQRGVVTNTELRGNK